jgi:hypothetical protein
MKRAPLATFARHREAGEQIRIITAGSCLLTWRAEMRIQATWTVRAIVVPRRDFWS